MQTLLHRQAHRMQSCPGVHARSSLRENLVCCATSGTSESHPQSRRQVLQGSGFAACVALTQLSVASNVYAEDSLADLPQLTSTSASSIGTAQPAVAAAGASQGGQRVYLDVKIEGKPAGRIVIQLFPDVPVGAQRFADFAVGKQGVAYRLSKFDGIFDTYIRNEGVKQLSYEADGVSPVAGGDSTQQLEQEMEAPSARRHDAPGLVSLLVKEVSERPIKERLVAMGGRLVTIKEQAGEAPNGSAFAITTAPAPELDAFNLVVGQVVEGQAVIDAIRALPIVLPRDQLYNKPFFEVGKAIGDKRATVAEKGFNRPLKRVLVASAGMLQ